jgi:hypothetical protein
MPSIDHRLLHGQRGIALAIAIFALVVIGGLVAGGFLGAVLEQQSGRNALFVTQAAEAAEAELREALVATPASALRSLEIGGASLPAGLSVVSPGLRVEHRVSRLSDNLFLIHARATRLDADGGTLAVRAVGMLARLIPDSSDGTSALRPVTERAWVQLY